MSQSLELTLEYFAEEWDDTAWPSVERAPVTERQRAWASDGVVIERKVIPEGLMSAYEEAWLQKHGGPTAVPGSPLTYERPMGWSGPTPYMACDPLRELLCSDPVSSILQEIIGHPMGLHLTLTGWKSSRRNWHFDQYLNEPFVGGFYAAVWIALDTIVADAGPFEFVRGSHRWWSPISQQKMREALGEDGHGPAWPTHSERILTPLFEKELEQRGIQPEQFTAQRGDLLIWHGRLLHRGSIPRNEALERRAVIGHYSATHRRPDMPIPFQHGSMGWYFPIPYSGPE
jgi:hypothetical protein